MLGTELNRVVMHNVIGQHQGASRVVDSFFVWYNLLPKGREKNQNKRRKRVMKIVFNQLSRNYQNNFFYKLLMIYVFISYSSYISNNFMICYIINRWIIYFLIPSYNCTYKIPKGQITTYYLLIVWPKFKLSAYSFKFDILPIWD